VDDHRVGVRLGDDGDGHLPVVPRRGEAVKRGDKVWVTVKGIELDRNAVFGPASDPPASIRETDSEEA
jgi:hypothetical protein